MKATWFCLFLSISVCANAQARFSYSSNDKKSLAIANKKLDRLDNLSFNEVYHVGLEYERLYRTYKDTNMVHAVRCYENCCSRENGISPSMGKSLAFKLGGIYEKGLGITSDTMMAMIWYKWSTPQGLKKLNALQNSFCIYKLQLTLNGNIALNTSDSMLMEKIVSDEIPVYIPFLATCPYSSKQMSQVMAPMVWLMKIHPERLLRIGHNNSVSKTQPSFSVIEHAYLLEHTIQNLFSFLSEKENISSNRLFLYDYSKDKILKNPTGINFIEMQLVTEN